ncbi:hypothetical protein BB561_003277 [Smittium simulii]|uniref:SMP-LTD domain-containing protein n=1 Tax=Smittium simulii TaxID=133385 RepID=A0A2T9YM94_9FUNG|nr:hypothetical protein BB561_003277 [Smittium simulii]
MNKQRILSIFRSLILVCFIALLGGSFSLKNSKIQQTQSQKCSNINPFSSIDHHSAYNALTKNIKKRASSITQKTLTYKEAEYMISKTVEPQPTGCNNVAESNIPTQNHHKFKKQKQSIPTKSNLTQQNNIDEPNQSSLKYKPFFEESFINQLGIESYLGGSGLSKFTFSKKNSKEKLQSKADIDIKKITKQILAKTSYNLLETPFETTNWLTVFIAQIYTKIRIDIEQSGYLSKLITESMNGTLKPSDSIKITQLSLGSDFPRVLAAKMSPSKGSFGMMAELNIELIDGLSFGFDTQLVLNWPQKSFASLPVSMVLSVSKFIGTVTVELDYKNDLEVVISIKPGYILDLNVQTLLGSNAKVQNLPMLTSIISRKIRNSFIAELVYPNAKRVPLNLPFYKKNIKEQSQPIPNTSDLKDLGISSVHNKTDLPEKLKKMSTDNSEYLQFSNENPKMNKNSNNLNFQNTHNSKISQDFQELSEDIVQNTSHINSSIPRTAQIPAWYNTQLPPQNSFSIQDTNTFNNQGYSSNNNDNVYMHPDYNIAKKGLSSILEYNKVENYTNDPLYYKSGIPRYPKKSHTINENSNKLDLNYDSRSYSNKNKDPQTIYRRTLTSGGDFDDNMISKHPLFPRSLTRELVNRKKKLVERKISQSQTKKL